MSSGSGSSFGEALISAIATFTDGVMGVRKSYTAKGWHAQISKITSSPRGYEAAERAGLSVNQRTLLDWLAEKREPNAANQELIAKAYSIMRGRWPDEVERKEFAIKGSVSMGDDTRERGTKGNAPLIIDGSQASRSDWEPMRRAWESGELDPEQFGKDFVAIIEADLGEFSVPPEFGGNDYTVVIS